MKLDVWWQAAKDNGEYGAGIYTSSIVVLHVGSSTNAPYMTRYEMNSIV